MVYRNKALLSMAAMAPQCFGCGKHNEGDVVSAHSNAQEDGKGMGLKASDACIAFLCHKCHHHVDAGRTDGGYAHAFWKDAHRRTLIWLIESGHLVVSVVPQLPTPAPPKPKKAMPKGRKLESAPFPKSEHKRAWPKRSFPKRPDK